ncbi:hypothetical protein HBH97_254560 [Parastagonospora nodorum]|nr:hypothetical protein HBH97_254560 [Parastagonospora nodorum]
MKSRRLLLLLVALSPAVCFAEPSVTEESPSSSASSAPTQTYTVQVGLADHKFQPDTVQAGIGDIVEFRFYPANHSVVRAKYGLPCVPYEMTGSQRTGFFSGFKPAPNYSIRINDTSPVFFYCSAPGSCISYGMVGAINPNASTPIAKQQQLARDSAYMLNPGEPFPLESPLPTDTPDPSHVLPKSGRGHSLSAGAIAGIVVAAIVVVVLLVILIFLIYGRIRKPVKNAEPPGTPSVRQTEPYHPIWSPVSTDMPMHHGVSNPPPYPQKPQEPQELPDKGHT